MGTKLQQRLKQEHFASDQQEGLLSLLVAASQLRADFDRLMSGFSISHEQYNILRILNGVYPDGHACGAIAERMIDRAPDITRRIDGLVRTGLVERARSENDRRVVVTKITPAGITLLGQIAVESQGLEKIMSERLTDEEWKQLTALCERLFCE